MLGLAAAAAAAALAPATAHAQSDADRATARQLGQEGFAALDQKDYPTAEDRLRRADRLVHAPTLMLGLARALVGEHKFVEAQEMYQRIIREGVPAGAPEAFRQALEDAKKEVDTASPYIGGVTITVKAAGGGDVPNEKVTIDGNPVNVASLGIRRAVDPGTHTLKVTADGFKTAEVKFTVAEGGSVDAPVVLEKDPSWVPPTATPVPGTAPGPGEGTPVGPTPVPGPTPGFPQPPPPGAEQPQGGLPMAVPIAAFGVGAAGLILGSVMGVVALGDHSRLTNECTAGSCDPKYQGDIDSYHSAGLISTVGFVVAGVGAAAGVVTLLLHSSGGSAAPAQPATGFQVTPVVGPGSFGAVGRF